MATEIEIVSTIVDRHFSLGDVIRVFEKNAMELPDATNFASSTSEFKKNGKTISRDDLITDPSAYYDIFRNDGEKLFSLWGPNHDVENELFTAEEKINDSPRFDLLLLPDLITRAAQANTSYTVRWSPTGSDLLVYIACFCISELVDGVIVNQFGSNITAGTYLSQEWQALLLSEFGRSGK